MKIFTQNPTIPYGSNTYILLSGNEAAIVDPSIDADTSLHPLIGDAVIKYIFVTHPHFDHILTLSEWKDKTGADVIVGLLDAPALSDPRLNCYSQFLGEDKGYSGEYVTVSEGDTLPLGDEIIHIMDTPGHTAGSITLICDDMAIVGDTVFDEGGIGRCDLPGGDFRQLFKTIDRIRRLPHGTKIYPGHGASLVL